MSKKYVPSFLKDQQSSSTPTQNTNTNTNTNASFWPGQKPAAPLSASNKFAALSDDFPMTKKEKAIVNTSLPAQLAPKLAPATLASITSNGSAPVASSGGSGSGPKKSFASKFAEQARIAADPNYKPPPKPVDFKSEDDFPSLGGPKKPAAGAWGAKPAANAVVESEEKPAVTSFADKAKEWANKRAEEAEKARQKAITEEKRRREAELVRSLPILGMRRRQDYNDDDDDEDYNPNYDESSLGDDSYEVPDEDEAPYDEEDDEEGEGEFNQNVGWDGRRKDDLY
jgi:hypothetical protein